MDVDEDFAEFVAARWDSLYRLAYLLAASPTGAEDLLQTTLGEGVRELGADQPDGVRRGVRAADAGQHAVLEPSAGLDPRAADGPPARECRRLAEVPVLDRSLLWPLVCALPDRQRAVIVLRYYEDLSEAQIADVLGCAPGTVKSQASAAMAALRRAVAAAGVGEAVDWS